MMQHSHGSTAIGGIAYYDDDQWPAEFRDNMFVGNVMTSRVNRDVLRFAWFVAVGEGVARFSDERRPVVSARRSCSSGPTARSTSPIFTTASSAITKCR